MEMTVNSRITVEEINPRDGLSIERSYLNLGTLNQQLPELVLEDLCESIMKRRTDVEIVRAYIVDDNGSEVLCRVSARCGSCEMDGSEDMCNFCYGTWDHQKTCNRRHAADVISP